MNRYRKFVTSGVGFSFLVVGLTGVIFKFLFKNHPLEEIHGWIGLIFVVAAGFHVVQNWPSLRNHLTDWRVFLLLVPIVLIIAGIAFGEGGEREGGNPRLILFKLSQGHAGDVAKAFGKDVDAAIVSIRAHGLRVTDSDQTVEDIARQNRKPPEEILNYFAQ